MTEVGKNPSEETSGQDGEAPDRSRPGSNPPREPQSGPQPGAGEDVAEGSGEPAQGFGEPDSH